MMTPDILDAVDLLYDRTSIPAVVEYLTTHGLNFNAIEVRAGCLWIVRGELFGSRWLLSDEGEVLAVVQVFDAHDMLAVDLVAWPVERDPTRFATMFGAAAVLGSARISDAASLSGSRPLRVFRSPLGWLRSGCRGVVILDRTEAPAVLAQAPGRIAGEDLVHGRELARLLHPHVDRARVVAPLREIA